MNHFVIRALDVAVHDAPRVRDAAVTQAKVPLPGYSRKNVCGPSPTGLKVVGSRFSADTRRLLEFAARNRLPHRWVDLEEDRHAEALLRGVGVGPDETPVVIWTRGDVWIETLGDHNISRALGKFLGVGEDHYRKGGGSLGRDAATGRGRCFAGHRRDHNRHCYRGLCRAGSLHRSRG